MFNVGNEDIFVMLIPQEDIAFSTVNECVFMWYLVNATGFVLCAKNMTVVLENKQILYVNRKHLYMHSCHASKMIMWLMTQYSHEIS
jgi:hypothetical protein